MERVNHRNGCHFFTACRPERPPETYRIEVGSDAALDAVPCFRYRCGLEGDTIKRPGWSMTLQPEQLALAQLIDGRRSIGSILALASDQAQSVLSREEQERFGRAFFDWLVNGDFLLFAL